MASSPDMTQYYADALCAVFVIRTSLVVLTPHRRERKDRWQVPNEQNMSDDPTPSPEDVAVTRQLVEAGTLLGEAARRGGARHLVIGQGRWVSLRERRLGFAG